MKKTLREVFFDNLKEEIQKNVLPVGWTIQDIRVDRECDDNGDCTSCEMKSLEWLNEEER